MFGQMRVISRRTLKAHWLRRPDSEQPLKAWFQEARHASWKSPSDVKGKYGNVSILRDGRCVFNIGGNKYRLVVWINYDYQIVYIRFIGTHREYDQIDSQTI
jgi:mRNA interferase HigB